MMPPSTLTLPVVQAGLVVELGQWRRGRHNAVLVGGKITTEYIWPRMGGVCAETGRRCRGKLIHAAWTEAALTEGVS